MYGRDTTRADAHAGIYIVGNDTPPKSTARIRHHIETRCRLITDARRCQARTPHALTTMLRSRMPSITYFGQASVAIRCRCRAGLRLSPRDALPRDGSGFLLAGRHFLEKASPAAAAFILLPTHAQDGRFMSEHVARVAAVLRCHVPSRVAAIDDAKCLHFLSRAEASFSAPAFAVDFSTYYFSRSY